MTEILGYLFGYFFGVFLAHFFIHPFVITMHQSIDPKKKEFPFEWQWSVLGYTERTLYISALLLETGGIIGAWLLLKVAVPYLRWQKVDDKEADNSNNASQIPRSRFMNSVIGNGLSVLYGFVGYGVIMWTIEGKIVRAIGVPSLLVLFTFLLMVLVKSKPSNEK